MISTFIVSPILIISAGLLILFHEISVTCNKPSTPPRSTYAPYYALKVQQKHVIDELQQKVNIMNEKRITSLLVVSDKDFLKRNKTLKGIIHIHFLLKNGISSDRITAEDLGSDQPASKGASMFSMAKNRRVEFIIIK